MISHLLSLFIAQSAIQPGANVFGSPFVVENPRKYLPRRIVPHVLRMSALQLRDPLLFIVLAKADDPSLDHFSRRPAELFRWFAR